MLENKKLERNATSSIAEVALCASTCALPTSATDLSQNSRNGGHTCPWRKIELVACYCYFLKQYSTLMFEFDHKIRP